MSWITPKTDWAASQVIGSADFNRIEGNIEYLYNQGWILTDSSSFKAIFKRDGYSDQTLNIYYDVINNNNVTLHFTDLTDMTTGVLKVAESTPVPASIRPHQNKFLPVLIARDLENVYNYQMAILTNGSLYYNACFYASSDDAGSAQDLIGATVQYHIS